jgi:hypothetical protein
MVIPLGPDKRPTIRTGRDHAEHATTDPAVIDEWYHRGLLDAVGCPTGQPNGIVVIDVDAKHDGEASLAALESPDVLGPLPRTRVARTRSGGLHVYLAHPGDRRIPSGATGGQISRLLKGRPGIDVRADGGLVVLPPSAGYTWIADEDGAPLPPIPPRWLAALTGAGEPPRPVPRPVPRVDDDRRLRRAAAYLDALPPAVSGSGGHDALWTAVCAAVVGFELGIDEARSLIDAFNARCQPPWSQRELEHKLRSAAERCTLPRGYLLAGGRP